MCIRDSGYPQPASAQPSYGYPQPQPALAGPLDPNFRLPIRDVYKGQPGLVGGYLSAFDL